MNELMKGLVEGMKEDEERFRASLKSHQDQLRSSIAKMFSFTVEQPQSAEMQELLTILQEVPALVKPALEFLREKVVKIKEAVTNIVNEQ